MIAEQGVIGMRTWLSWRADPLLDGDVMDLEKGVVNRQWPFDRAAGGRPPTANSGLHTAEPQAGLGRQKRQA